MFFLIGLPFALLHLLLFYRADPDYYKHPDGSYRTYPPKEPPS